MRFSSVLLSSPHSTKSIEQKTIFLLRNSTKLNHLLQIHSFTIKTSLDKSNFILAKFLCQLFSCSSSKSLPYARSLFDRIRSPDTFIWNSMIRAYLNAPNHRESVSLFFQMRVREDIVIDSFSLSLVLQACGRSVNDRDGKRIHTHVWKLGFVSDSFVRTALIEMYAKCGTLDIAEEVLDEMREPDLVSYNVMLAQYIRVGEIELARRLFDKMPEKDLVSWNTLIHGFTTAGNRGDARQLSDTSRKSNEALRLFHEMQLANVKPDKVTMVGVLSACGETGALNMGKMIHEYIERNRIEVDLKLGTCLVDMYAKCGDIVNSLEVFNKMGLRDVLTWSAMIIGLANHGFAELSLDHFSKMISEGFRPNGVTFVGVLSACSHAGLIDVGCKYFRSMSDIHRIEPKIEHYGCLVDLLGRAGRLNEARELIRSMPFSPDAVVWRALLGGCRIHKNIELAEEAAVNLLHLEPQVDGNYILLSNVYSEAKNWEKVINTRNMMRGGSIQKLVPGSSSIEVDNSIYEFIADDESHPKSSEIYQLLNEISDQLNMGGYEPAKSSLLLDVDENHEINTL